MESGVYEGLTFEEYCEVDAVNASTLKAMAVSAAHAYDSMTRSEETKRHFQFGQATHTWLLEPHLFNDHVCVATRCVGKKKDGERCSNTGLHRYEGEWYCGVRGHLPGPADTVTQAVVTADEYEQMKLAAESLCSHDKAMQLMTSDGSNELTVIARHEKTGLLLKSRIDLYRPAFKTVADLKTCKSAAKWKFSNDMASLGYDLQAAFYTHVARMAGLHADHFVFVAVEKTRPFLTSAVRVTDVLIDAAWTMCERLLDEFLECKESGVWPGYSTDIEDIDVPPWRYDVLYGSVE